MYLMFEKSIFLKIRQLDLITTRIYKDAVNEEKTIEGCPYPLETKTTTTRRFLRSCNWCIILINKKSEGNKSAEKEVEERIDLVELVSIF